MAGASRLAGLPPRLVGLSLASRLRLFSGPAVRLPPPGSSWTSLLDFSSEDPLPSRELSPRSPLAVASCSLPFPAMLRTLVWTI